MGGLWIRAQRIGWTKSARHNCTLKLENVSTGNNRQLKCFLKILASPPLLPTVLGELKKLQSEGDVTDKESKSPVFSHVSVINRKSNLWDTMKSLLIIQVLLDSDLVLIKAIFSVSMSGNRVHVVISNDLDFDSDKVSTVLKLAELAPLSDIRGRFESQGVQLHCELCQTGTSRDLPRMGNPPMTNCSPGSMWSP